MTVPAAVAVRAIVVARLASLERRGCWTTFQVRCATTLCPLVCGEGFRSTTAVPDPVAVFCSPISHPPVNASSRARLRTSERLCDTASCACANSSPARLSRRSRFRARSVSTHPAISVSRPSSARAPRCASNKSATTFYTCRSGRNPDFGFSGSGGSRRLESRAKAQAMCACASFAVNSPRMICRPCRCQSLGAEPRRSRCAHRKDPRANFWEQFEEARPVDRVQDRVTEPLETPIGADLILVRKARQAPCLRAEVVLGRASLTSEGFVSDRRQRRKRLPLELEPGRSPLPGSRGWSS